MDTHMLRRLKQDSMEELADLFDWLNDKQLHGMLQGLTAIQLNNLRIAVDRLKQEAHSQGREDERVQEREK